MKRRNKYFRQDREAMRIAAASGMTAAYKEARRNGCTPFEALEDWDLLPPELRDIPPCPPKEPNTEPLKEFPGYEPERMEGHATTM